MFRKPKTALFMIAIAWGLGAALIGAASAQSRDCARYEAERAQYVATAINGITPHVHAMAIQRDIAPEVATFYWAGALIQADDAGSRNTLADLTLASSVWPGQSQRAYQALERLYAEDRNLRAGLLAGLALSGQDGEADPIRARAYLAEIAREGRPEAQAFLALFDACHGRRMAMR
ncbi:hypothetical protein [Maricaulis alexandrii]|uniref:hypothetical protein n=1 Tax=Maricaulis alexandrii TaxID=2570354 RepID=UPI0011095716|nr:hypothetical protein [Maricaulis alexandrii]